MAEMLILYASLSFQSLQPPYERSVGATTPLQHTPIKRRVLCLFAKCDSQWNTVTCEVKFNCIYNKVTRCV